MWRLRHGEVKWTSQAYTASKGQSWALNPDRLVSWSLLLPITLYLLGWMGRWVSRLAGYYIYYWRLLSLVTDKITMQKA